MEDRSRESYTILPMSLSVDANLPRGSERVYNGSSCISLPCRNCQACVCVTCRKWDAPLEERTAGLDSKKLFAELLAA